MSRARLALLLLLATAALPLQADTPNVPEPPLKNRPARFNGAVGTFEAAMEAAPTELHLDETLTLKFRVTAAGPVVRPPSRPDLAHEPRLTDKFHVETLPAAETSPQQQSWEFVYRLKPRSTAVDAVPSLPFIFFKPGPGPGGGSYQTVYAARVPLTVTEPKPATLPTTPQDVPLLQAPDSVTRIATGPAVLRHPSGWLGPAVGLSGLVLLGTPLLCVLGYRLWRRWYPDAARLARRRRSQAAQHALKSLRSLRRETAAAQPADAAGILTTYLYQRVELTAAEPTPEEAAAALRRARCSDGLVDAVALFFRDCDRARFAPQTPASVPWPDTASSLVLAVENELWLSQAS
jgi:hypothetical protein